MSDERAALLIRCSSQEAELQRESAKGERRTLSGFVLNAVLQYRRPDDSQIQVSQQLTTPLGLIVCKSWRD